MKTESDDGSSFHAFTQDYLTEVATIMKNTNFLPQQWTIISCLYVVNLRNNRNTSAINTESIKNRVVQMAKIFWVEDQSHWVNKLKPVILSADIDGKQNEVSVYKFSEAAKQQIKLISDADKPDVALLDARMNGNDQAGFSVSKALHAKWPGLPIIFLSEHNGTEIERDALETHHANDFISKNQTNIEEVLCWRIKATMRQASLQSTGNQSLPGNIIVKDDLKIDLDSWEVYWHNNKLMNPDNDKRPLAPTPRKILRCLVERSPRPVTPSQMAEFLKADPDTYAAATYRQHIKTLRRSFDASEDGEPSFSQQCKEGKGIVAVGDEGAYCWK